MTKNRNYKPLRASKHIDIEQALKSIDTYNTLVKRQYNEYLKALKEAEDEAKAIQEKRNAIRKEAQKEKDEAVRQLETRELDEPKKSAEQSADTTKKDSKVRVAEPSVRGSFKLWDWNKNTPEPLSTENTPRLAVESYKQKDPKYYDSVKFIESDVHTRYDNKIKSLLEELLRLERMSAYPSPKKDQLKQQIEQLTIKRDQYRLDMNNSINPRANIVSTFATMWDNVEKNNPQLYAIQNEAFEAQKQFDSLKARQQQELDELSGKFFLYEDNEKKNSIAINDPRINRYDPREGLIRKKYEPLLIAAAKRALSAREVLDRKLNKYRQLNKYIMTNGWDTNPNNIPKDIREIAEEMLPGSTQPKTAEQLITNSYIGNKELIRDNILRRLKETKQALLSGISTDISQELLQSNIDRLESFRSQAEYLAKDDPAYKDYMKTGGRSSLVDNVMQQQALKRADQDYEMYGKALDVLNRAKEYRQLSEDAEKGNWYNMNPFDDTPNTFGMGVMHTISKKNFWDFGISDLKDAVDNMSLINKVNNGEKLTSGELSYLDALAIDQIMLNNHGLFQEAGGFKAGEVTATSLKFMLDFLVSKGMLSSAASTAGKGAAKSVAKFMLGQTGDKLMEKAAYEAVEKYGTVGVKAALQKYIAQTPGFLVKMGGDAAYALALENTLLIGKTASDVINLHNGNVAYDVDEAGNVKGTGFTDGVGWGDAIYTAEARGFVENFSEQMGEWGIGTILGKMFKGIGSLAMNPISKIIGKRNLVAMRNLGKSFLEKSQQFIRNNSSQKLRKYAKDFVEGNTKFQDFMKSGQYHGFVGEMSEEYYGMALDHLFRVNETDNSFWEDLTDKQQFFDIFGGIAASSALLGMGAQIHYGWANHKYNQAVQMGKSTFGNKWQDILDAIVLAEDRNAGAVMARLTDNAQSDKEKEVLLNYFNRLQQLRGVSAFEQKLHEEQMLSAHQQSVIDSKKSGYLTYNVSRRRDLKRAIDVLDKRLAEQHGVDQQGLSMQEYIEAYGGVESMMDYMPDLTTEERNQLYAFDNMLSAYDGMTQRYYDNVDDIAQELSRNVDRISHRNGNVILAVTNNGEKLYIVDGDVKYNNKGEIDFDKSDKQVKVRTEEGDTKIIDTSELQKVNGTRDAASMKAETVLNVMLRMQVIEDLYLMRGITVGEEHDFGDGRKLTILGAARDGGMLYSISDGTNETVGHEQSLQSMQLLIDNVNEGRINTIIQRAVQQSQDDDTPMPPTPNPKPTEIENQEEFERQIAERDAETLGNKASAFIPTTNKNGARITSGKAFDRAKGVVRKLGSIDNFEQFKTELNKAGLNFDLKYEGRLRKLFNALKKGNISAADFAYTFVNPQARGNVKYSGIDIDNVNIDDDGNIIANRKRRSYVAPETSTHADISMSPEYLIEDDEVPPVDISMSPEYLFEDDEPAPEANISGSNEAVNNTATPDPQQRVWNKILQHLRETKQTVDIALRTGHDYFVKINGKLVMYRRLHSVLDPLYTKSPMEEFLYNKVKGELNQAYNTGVESLEQFVKNHARYNSKLDVYLQYIKDNPNESVDVIEGLASELSRTEPGPSVDYGNIIDTIQREFFRGIDVDYETITTDSGISIKKSMNKETFDKIIKDLQALRKTYDLLGWKISSEPHVFYSEFVDTNTGKTIRVAGETDAIAITPDGKIVIIDTKTSLNLYTDKQDSTNPLFSFTGRMAYSGARLLRSQGEFYLDQLSVYARMVEDATGESVESIEITPWHLSYKFGEFLLNGAENSPQRIPLVMNNGLMSRYGDVTPEYLERSAVELAKLALEDAVMSLYDLVGELHDVLTKESQILSSGLYTAINSFVETYNGLLENHKQSNSIADCRRYQELVQQLVDLYDQLSYEVGQQRSEYEQMIAEQEEAAAAAASIPEVKQEADAEKDAVATTNLPAKADRFAASTFSKTSGLSNGIESSVAEDNTELRLLDVTGNPDFIDNALFEFILKTVTNNAGNTSQRIHVVVTYNGHRYTPVAIYTANTDAGRNFSNLIKRQLRQAKIGQAVVPNKVSRSSGIIKQGKMLSVTNSGLVSTDRNGSGIYIYDVEYSENLNMFGITKTYITPIGESTQAEAPSEQGRTGGRIIHIYSEEQREKAKVSTGSNGILAGAVVMMVERNFNEQSGVRVPITLRNAGFTLGDVDLIFDILTGKYGRLDDEFIQNGTPLGITNRDVINLLIPTQVDLDSTSQPLRLEIQEHLNILTGDYSIGSVYLVGNVQGTGVVEGNPLIIDIHSQEGIEQAKQFFMNYVRKNINLDTASIRMGRANLQGHPFTKLRSALQGLQGSRMFAKGAVKIGNSSIVFEQSDFKDPTNSEDTKGLSGLAWYMKNGFLETDFDGFENSLLAFDDQAGVSTIERGSLIVPETTVETSKTPETDALRRAREQAERESELDELMRLAGFLDRSQDSSSTKPLNEKTARKRLEKIFGENGIPVEFVDDSIAMLRSGARVVGRCYADSIVLSRLAEQGTEWHEAFHRVVELLLPEDERKKVYNAYRNAKKDRKNLSDAEVAERLADEFWYYMENRPTFKLTFNLKKLFKQSADWIKMLNNIGSFRLYRLYSQTNSGRFRNVQPTQEAMDRFTKIAPYGYNYKVGDINFDNLLNIHQLKDLVHSLSYALISEHIKHLQANNTILGKVDISVEALKNSEVYKKWMEYLPKNNPATHKLLEEATEKFDSLVPLVLAAVREFISDDLQIDEEENDAKKDGLDTTSQDGDETTSEEGIASVDPSEHTKASYEQSQFSRASVAVRLFFAGIPTTRPNSLGLVECYPVKYLFNSILNEVHDCKSVEDLLRKLSKLGRQVPMYNEIAKKMFRLYVQAWGDFNNKQLRDADAEALLSKLYGTLKTTKGSFKIIKSYKQGLTWYHELESTDLNYVADQYVRDWSQLFAAGASRYVTVDKLGRLIMKSGFVPSIFRTLYYKIAGNINTIKDQGILGLTYAYSDIANQPDKPKYKLNGKEVDVYSPEGVETVKDELLDFITSLGISFDRDMLDYMLLHKYGAVGSDGLKKLFSDKGLGGIESFAKFLNGLILPIKDGNTVIGTRLNLNEEGNAIGGVPVNKIFNGQGFVRELANWKYKYNHAHEQLSVLGTNKNKMFLMSENNLITDRLLELKDGTFLDKLKAVSYIFIEGLGSRIVKQMSNDSSTNLQFVTHSGYKSDEYGDEGIDYAQINKREDYITKMTVLLGGHILLPTMSDKKTFGWIEGIKTVGINWDSAITSLTDVLAGGKILVDSTGTVIIPVSNAVLDQMIEYAITENMSVKHALFNERDAEKVDNYHVGSKIVDKEGRELQETLKNLEESLKHASSKQVGQIQKLITELKQQIAKHTFTTINGARYTGLLGVYDHNGEFVEFNRVLDEDGNYVDERKNYDLAQRMFFNQPLEEQRKMMQKIISKQLVEELQEIEKLGLIKRRAVTGNVPLVALYENVGLDSRKIKLVRDAIVSAIPRDQQSNAMLDMANSYAIAVVVQDAMLRSFQSIQEFERVFSGNPSFYKLKWDSQGHLTDRTTDQFKRLGGLVSTGTNNNLSCPGIPHDYTCAEVDNEMIQAPEIARLGELMTQGEIRKAYLNYLIGDSSMEDFLDGVYYEFGELGRHTISEIEDIINGMSNEEIETKLSVDDRGTNALNIAKKIASLKTKAFNKIDVADGGAYISDTMCENLLRMVGSYGKDVERAFKILRGEKVDGRVYSSKDIVEIADAYEKVLTTVIGNQKYTAYGFRFQDGLAVPYYNKMALFPMFKVLSTGGMANVYDTMKKLKIDMIMVKSAVKVGGQGSKPIDWESCRNGNFRFNTYKQEYAYLRKQFNTDPKEKDLMSMGTQMTKVAMSLLRPGRSFNVRGERISAKALRDDIMSCINGLSINGAHLLEEMFFNDGLLNVAKFSSMLIEELSGRGADNQMLDSVKTVIRNGKRELNIPLVAQSGVNWIQSILVSMINKRTIDINTPGEAFYQRSVWGMEGKTSVIGDDDLPSDINNGNTLQMINEEGSMDCVLSIDYFEGILKKATVKTGRKVKKTRVVTDKRYKKTVVNGVTTTDYTQLEEYQREEEYEIEEEVSINTLSFNEQKQWLIDHGIIGNKATANMIGYRIPTQAVSSIHPLRCVDVLPVVRHTVILPAEFTKITGSDRQHHCSNQYNIKNPFNCGEAL